MMPYMIAVFLPPCGVITNQVDAQLNIRINIMSLGLLGRKVGMTQIYGEDGRAIGVTVIEAGPCFVLQVRTAERDGYSAVQLGFGEKPRRLASRAERGHVAAISSKRSKART